MATSRICSVAGCGKKTIGQGLCSSHYTAKRRWGDPMHRTRQKQPAECTVDGCSRRPKSKGLCDLHYQRLQKNGDPLSTPRFEPKFCSIDGCSKPHLAKGYCSTHYGKIKRFGRPDGGRSTTPAARGEPLAWLIANVDHTGDECLIWPFSRTRQGYSQIVPQEGVEDHSAHRVMCRLKHGDPPTPEHFAAHDCGNGHLGCVHPEHLYWATPQQNTMDRYRHGTMLFGAEAPAAKLTTAQVREIRSLKGIEKQRDIAARMGVSKSLVGAIQRGEVWRLV